MQAFVSLVQLTKVHQSKVAVQGQAVKHGGRFVASFAKTLPFWRRHHDSAGRHFVSIVSELQRGTKLLQVRPRAPLARAMLSLNVSTLILIHLLNQHAAVLHYSPSRQLCSNATET